MGASISPIVWKKRSTARLFDCLPALPCIDLDPEKAASWSMRLLSYLGDTVSILGLDNLRKPLGEYAATVRSCMIDSIKQPASSL